MKINGVELEDIDILDLEVAENYEKALENIQELGEKVKDLGMVESMRTQCNAVFDVFNTMFGEGTDKKIFGYKVNLLTCLKAFEELVTQINARKSEVEKLVSKYSPNRAARRSKK